MQIRPFALERWFARFEFSVPHLLSSSDCDGLAQSELFALADEETSALWRDLKLGYTESQGSELLRREIASLYEGLSPVDVETFCETAAREAFPRALERFEAFLGKESA